MPVNYLGDVSRAIYRHKKIKKFLKIQQQVAFLTANLHNKKINKILVGCKLASNLGARSNFSL